MNPLCQLLRFYGHHCRHPGHWRILECLIGSLRPTLPEKVTVHEQGLTWHLHPHDRVQHNLFWYGEMDRWDLWHIKRLLAQTKAPQILDIGANFGYYSLILASRLNEGTHIDAFEPSTGTSAKLKANISANDYQPRIRVHQVALGKNPGTATLGHIDGDSGQARITAEGNEGETVTVTSLDAWSVDHLGQRKVDFIKIDVEGHEPEVLEGARRCLSADQPILLIELNPNALARNKHTPVEVMKSLHALGYKLYIAKRRTLATLNAPPPAGEFLNVFCLPG